MDLLSGLTKPKPSINLLAGLNPLDTDEMIKDAIGPAATIDQNERDYDSDFEDNMVIKVNEKRSQQYRDLFKQTAEESGIPEEFLMRQAMAESSFLPDIISGKRKSSAGAIGMMQIIPKWHPDVKDPTDPKEAVPYAAKYVNQLRKAFGGDWRKAFAAYNWGPGNLRKALRKHGDNWEDNLPEETKGYLEKILGSRDQETV